MTHIKIDALPTDSSDRLRLVADIIETNPSQYYQGDWVRDPAIAEPHTDEDDDFVMWPRLDPSDVVGRDNVCGTTACQAGWLVSLTPELPKDSRWTWETAGAYAGGLDLGLARRMFEGYFGQNRPVAKIAEFLRALADLDPADRTVEFVEEHLPELWYPLAYPNGYRFSFGGCSCDNCEEQRAVAVRVRPYFDAAEAWS